MELYSLEDNFLPRKLIDPFISAIWTERYSAAGDFQVVVEAPSILADELSRGRFLAMRGSKEIMVVENRTIEKGLLTATGPSLVKFFNQREAWFENPDYDPAKEKLPIPEAQVVSITDYSGSGPLTVTVPEIADEGYDGRTIMMVLYATSTFPASPVIDHPNGSVTDVVMGASVGGGSLTYNEGAWRLKKSGDRTFRMRDLSNVANPIDLGCRVLVLRGLAAPPTYNNAANSFTGGYGTNPPALGEQNGGAWTDKRRWLAWLAYRRTDLGSGHTLAAPAAISGGDGWTDNGESSAPAGTDRTIRIRTATDLTGSAAGHRPGATFHPAIEWADPPADQGTIQVIGLGVDTAQQKQPESSTTPLYSDYTTDEMQAGEFLAFMLAFLLISPTSFGEPYDIINLDWADEKIPGLAIGPVDANGLVKKLTFPIGPIYDSIQKIAEEQHLGFKLYLASASSAGDFVLKFATYRGLNRTSNQTVTRLIRMSPDMDSLLNSKEFVTSENYKNVVYVTHKNRVTMHFFGSVEPLGFNRRVIRVDAPDVNVKPEKNAAFRNQVAWNTLIQHRRTSAVDGQLQTVSGHKFTKDYYLGDVIELVGSDGVLSVVQVTEHIRSQDQYGFKEYPTLSDVDPVLFDFDNDLRGDELDPDWNGNPNFDSHPIIILPPPE